jgi:hypothetical protein
MATIQQYMIAPVEAPAAVRPLVEVALFCASHTGAMMMFTMNLRTG